MAAPDVALLTEACEELAAADRALARAFEDHGVPVWRSAEPCYAAVARTIAYQQISTSAAGAIWGRVCADLGEISHEAILACEEERLRGHGLSRPKIRHLRSIAEAVATGDLDFQRVCAASPEEARAELLAVKGIGPWTANLFMLYAAADLDAFPIADVGLMESYRLLSDTEERPDSKVFTQMAEAWRPYRGVAAHLLWGWINDYRASRGEVSPQA